MAKAKKQPVKRKYVRKATNLVPVVKPDEPTDNELQLLTLICSVFDNWSKDQKERNLKYLVGRYYDFM